MPTTPEQREAQRKASLALSELSRSFSESMARLAEKKPVKDVKPKPMVLP